ncbi:MAG: alanine racemase [Bacteroidota bacterium]
MEEKTYFGQLNEMLRARERALPCLLLDLDRVDKNVALLRSQLRPDAHFRIVVKSLPSPELIQYLMEKGHTDKLMVFHQPFLTDLAARLDHQADVLLGKPLPIKTADYFFKYLPPSSQGFHPFKQIQWLVDTSERVLQYIELAKKLGQKLRLNLELDIGLRRGGFNSLESLRTGLEIIQQNLEWVELSGFMGYDPHVVNIPSMIMSQTKALRLANSFYQEAKMMVRQAFPSIWKEDLCFNGAGSPTFPLHQSADSPLNDLSAGSCLVMPAGFDIASLQGYLAASFIATPVLKKFKGTTIPGLERVKGVLNMVSKENMQSFFLYGGYWKAQYWYPKGLKQNEIFGPSTNQTMVNAPLTAKLDVDDFVFLRPKQSEFVFLHFGEILPIREGQFLAPWSLLNNR